MKVKVLWLSRHEPTRDQVADLTRIFGDVDIVQEAVTISRAEEVRELMDRHGATELVAVLPVNLLGDLTRLGVRPLRVVMNRTVHPDGTATFSHSHFERVEKVDVVTTRL